MNIVYPQQATYWGQPVPTGYGGHEFDIPEVIRCRWEQKTEEFIDKKGATKLSQAVVYVDQDVEVGGYLYLGDTSEADPTALKEALPIQRYAKVPDIRAVEYVRKVWL